MFTIVKHVTLICANSNQLIAKNIEGAMEDCSNLLNFQKELKQFCILGAIFIKHWRWKTNESKISLSSPSAFVFCYLKTIYVDLDTDLGL